MIGEFLLAAFQTGDGGCVAAYQCYICIVQEAVSKACKLMAIPHCCRAELLKNLVSGITPRLLDLHFGHIYAADVLHIVIPPQVRVVLGPRSVLFEP
jgi:hypothetical protein